MANSPIFMSNNGKYYRHHLDFKWHGGFSIEQTQRCIKELHASFKEFYPELNVIEISTKSPNTLGVQLSAFNLRTENGASVESIYQGSKVFDLGGPYTDLYLKSSYDAKKDERLKTSGMLCGFKFKENSFDLKPPTLFYNWLYINSLILHDKLALEILEYQGFTDIVLSPTKSVNSQAEALSIYVTLHKRGLLEKALSSIESFSRTVYGKK